jgi:hypothetical protein
MFQLVAMGQVGPLQVIELQKEKTGKATPPRVSASVKEEMSRMRAPKALGPLTEGLGQGWVRVTGRRWRSERVKAGWGLT